jgi:predicted PurR-regulated permease PerM
MYGTGATRLAWIVGGVVLAVVMLDVLLLVFAGILFAVFLRTLSGLVSRHTPISQGWALVMVIVLIAAATGVVALRVAPDVADEVDQLIATAPQLLDDATSSLEAHSWGRWLLDRADGTTDWLAEPRTMRRAASMVGSTIGLVSTGFVILLVGLFIAAEPRVYRDGVLRLVPRERRGRAREILDDVGRVLRAWLLGKLIAMAAIFVVTWAGLALLGVPIALTLALLAAALTFIPNFGPVLAAIPAVLLGLQQGTPTALGVVGLYVGAQAVESFVLTPLIQRKAVSLPPALTLVAQVAMGVVAGGLGLLLATPIAAAVLTIVRGLTPPVRDDESNDGEMK